MYQKLYKKVNKGIYIKSLKAIVLFLLAFLFHPKTWNNLKMREREKLILYLQNLQPFWPQCPLFCHGRVGFPALFFLFPFSALFNGQLIGRTPLTVKKNINIFIITNRRPGLACLLVLHSAVLFSVILALESISSFVHTTPTGPEMCSHRNQFQIGLVLNNHPSSY